jgi:maltose O-acetyltransferase
MTEREKAELGYLYDACYDKELCKERDECAEKIFKLNQIPNSREKERHEILKDILGRCFEDTTILSPFSCDYGYHIKVGKMFFMNYGCVILDTADVTFGDHVFVAPNCVFSCPGHAIDAELRNKGYEIARKITIGNNVWIGASVTILPGITIGDNSIIGAGSVVTHDIPKNVIAVGNPCHILRKITPEDKDRYPIYKGN